MPLSGTTCHRCAGTSCDRPICTKLEISTFTHYEDKKDRDENCKKSGWFGELGITQATWPFDRVHTTSYSTLTETMRLSCNVYEL